MDGDQDTVLAPLGTVTYIPTPSMRWQLWGSTGSTSRNALVLCLWKTVVLEVNAQLPKSVTKHGFNFFHVHELSFIIDGQYNK